MSIDVGPAPSTTIVAVPLRQRVVGRAYATQILLTSLPLILSDVLVAVSGIGIGACLLNLMDASPINHYPAVISLVLCSLIAFNGFHRLYPAAGLHPIRELSQLVTNATLVCGILFVSAIAQLKISPYLPLFGVLWIWTCVLLMPFRCLVRRMVRSQEWWGLQAVMLGAGTDGFELAEKLSCERRRGVKLIGAFASGEQYWQDDFTLPESCPYLGPFAGVREYVDRNKVFWAYLPQSSLDGKPLQQMFEQHNLAFPNLVLVNDQHILPGLWNETVELENGLGGLMIREKLTLAYPRFVKRLFDVIACLIGLILLSPLYLLLILAVWLTSGRPVFFGDNRVGRSGRDFQAWKFRTMVLNADSALEEYLSKNPDMRAEWDSNLKLKNDPRITFLGKFLRRTSLDELPQLINVLRGEMSLVGPRPIPASEIEKYADDVYRSYLRVRPGITGLWQTNGRNNTTYEERLSFDSYYVTNWSLWMDLYILGRTFKTVLFQEGAY